MAYPGGKARCFQHIINLIPPHRIYIETHLGGGAVLRHKAAAEINIGIDRDSTVIDKYRDQYGANYQFIAERAEDFLARHQFDGSEFIYLDPPYWPASRRSIRSPYRYDYSEADHVALLKQVRNLPCPVIISGYRNPCYDTMLGDWQCQSFPGTSHIGRREETVWFNYEPRELHDLRYLGRSFRERQSIKRRRSRWLNRFTRESRQMQQALISDFLAVITERGDGA